MRKLFMQILTGLLLSFSTVSETAWGDEAKFRFANNAPETVYMMLFSRTREHWRWPSSNKRWILNPGQQAYVEAGQCQLGEYICYGGGNQSGSKYWGVSLDGKKGCSNCCIHCGKAHGWTLSEHPDPPTQPHMIDNGPVLVPATD